MSGDGILNAFRKDIWREIKNTLGRFLGILTIVALGVSFYTGLAATGPDMKQTGDSYFRRQNLMDLRVISTYGLTDADITALRETTGVRQVYAAYNCDAMFEMPEESITLKLHGIDISTSPAEWINKPVLVSGRFPENANEILVEGGFLWVTGHKLGDSVTLISGKESPLRGALRNDTFTIVGTAQTPYYLSHERGTGSIGSGGIDGFAFIPDVNFRQSVYSEAFITIENPQGASCFSGTYEQLINSITARLEAIGEQQCGKRFIALVSDAYENLRTAQNELDEQARLAMLQFADAEQTLANAAQNVRAGHAQAAGGQNEFLSQATTLLDAEASLYDGLRALQDGLAELLSQENDLRRQLIDVNETIQGLQTQEAALCQQEQALAAAGSEAEPLLAQVRAGLAQVQGGLAQAAAGRGALTNGLAVIADTRLSLEGQIRALYSERDKLLGGKDALLTAQSQLDSASRETLAATLAITAHAEELTFQKADALAALALGREQITAQLDSLNSMTAPTWYVLGRSATPGYSSFAEDTNKIVAIGKVFPLIFFIVAALVSLTTMTRLVEERRTEIGTLKSLGYSNFRIMSKYLFYAAAPTLLGGAIGGIIGMKLFPALIINAYGMLYTLPATVTPLQFGVWLVAMAMAVCSTVLAAVFACANELRAMPSAAMRPKAPKTGKRTVLERITFFWRLLSFTHKVTIRNLTRYKKRFLMTVIGISGCTGLLLTGFGVRDSVSDIVGLQFGSINQYNVSIHFRDGTKESDISSVMNRLAENQHMQMQMRVRQKTMEAGAGLNDMEEIALIVPESASAFAKYVVLRDRSSHAPFALTTGSVIITEKLSRQTGLAAGDTIVIRDGDTLVSATISAVTEHYFLHNIYMAPELYEFLFDEAAAYNTIFGQTSNESKAAQNELAALVLDEGGVSGINFSKWTRDTFSDIVNNLNFVVLVLIISAGALAFVVLLNLTNINISERIRELATIAVLGFTDREMSAYVYRENAALTVIGAGIGLWLGVFFHAYVIRAAETDMFMFGMRIQPLSFVYSLLLTFAFSAVVNILTAGKLRKIDMVEALKSVE